MAKEGAKVVQLRDVLVWARPILSPDKSFFVMAIIYGVAISLLSLATPISVQLLINSIANTALPAPLFTLAAILFVLLALSGVLSAFRSHLMEIFRRRFFARLVAEITLRAVHARNPFFNDERSGDLFNRYFDVMNVQKAVPSLLIGLFTIILQSAVGFVVTSLYHPIFLAFNLVFILLVWIIWAIWSRGAMTHSVQLSHAKYHMAHWLESVGGSNGFYKSGRHISFAINKSEELTSRYIAADIKFFGYSFSQTVAFLMLYALASASLLALGGWLVIERQLSIGQLVAAELILSSIFYGTAQLGPYLDTFYDLVAALEELDMFFAIPQEVPPRNSDRLQTNGELAFANAKIGDLLLNLTVPSGTKLIAAGDPYVQRTLGLLLKRHRGPDTGFVMLGGADISALDIYRVRSDVIVLDRPSIVESTIIDYLELASPDASANALMDAIKLVGLEPQIGRLPDGVHSELSGTGWPLALSDVMRLKFAAAILAQPRILLLTPLFDIIPSSVLERMLDAFRGTPTTLIYFTNRSEPPTLDGYLWFGRNHQEIVADRTAFNELRNGGSEAVYV